VAKEIGFPVLYNALIPANAAPPSVSIQEDVKIMPPVFTFIAIQSQTALTSSFANLEIKDEKNSAVGLHISPSPLSIEGTTGDPSYVFSVDTSALIPGIYNFKVGNYEKKFFIANGMDVFNSVSLVRILKNSFLEYKTSLADSSFAAFELIIPKV